MTKSDAPLISAGEHSAFLLSGVSASEAANLPPRTIPSLHRRRVHFVAFLARDPAAGIHTVLRLAGRQNVRPSR
jgi:hypothetical protein